MEQYEKRHESHKVMVIWKGHITHVTFSYSASDRHREGTNCCCKMDFSFQVFIDLQGWDNRGNVLLHKKVDSWTFKPEWRFDVI